MQGFKNRVAKEEFELSLHTLITGDNGKGKTSIGESITWGFFGSNLWGNDRSDAKLINKDASITEIEIDFRADGVKHNIIRRKKKKDVDVYLDDEKITTEALLNKLDLDKKTFITIFNPVYFSGMEPKDAKEFLIKKLGDVAKEDVLDAMGEPYKGMLLENNFRNPDMFLEDRKQDMKDAEDDLIYLEGMIDGNKVSEEVPDVKTFDDTELSTLRKKLYAELSEGFTPPHDLEDIRRRKLEAQQNILKVMSEEVNLIDTTKMERELAVLENKLNLIPIKDPELIDIKALYNKKQDLVTEYNELSKEFQQCTPRLVSCPNCQLDIDIKEQERERIRSRALNCKRKGESLTKEIADSEIENFNRMEKYNHEIKEHRASVQADIDALTEELKKVRLDNEVTLKFHNDNVAYSINTLNAEIASLDEHLQKVITENLEAKNKHEQDKLLATKDLKDSIMELEKIQIEVTSFNAKRVSLIEQLQEAKDNVQKAKDKIVNVNARINTLKQLIDAGKKYNSTKLDLQARMIQRHLDKVSIRLKKYIPTTGEIKDDFAIMYDGKEFNVLSTSEQIKAGLEISNLIMNVMDIKYPVFIDNKESITEYKAPDTQIIEAMVVEDQELQIAHIEEA
jgi:DNA repair exonuclease SbcCD ATPase subunit